MKNILLALLVLVGPAHAQVTTCNGDFALCAASTCQPTGKMITTNTGDSYPEVVCRCPILNGIAHRCSEIRIMLNLVIKRTLNDFAGHATNGIVVTEPAL